MARGYMGARSQFDLGDEDYPACENCGDGSGWSIWYGRIPGDHFGEFYPVALFAACADCNDDEAKPFPAPWPVCPLCEESKSFCHCGRVLVN